MNGEYAPQAIVGLYAACQAGWPGLLLSGILGDAAHTYGYHRARAVLPGDDYSVTLPRDQGGDPWAASALDITPGDRAGMITITNRLLAAAMLGDRRMAAVREFCGTTDGIQTHPYDLSSGQDGPLDSWDSSHLWHVHLSLYRDAAEDPAALAPIADVILGRPVVYPASPPPPAPPPPPPIESEDEMYIRFINSGPRCNTNAVYRVDGAELVHIDKLTYSWINSPPVFKVDMRSIFWSLPVAPNTPDYRGK